LLDELLLVADEEAKVAVIFDAGRPYTSVLRDEAKNQWWEGGGAAGSRMSILIMWRESQLVTGKISGGEGG